jgi:uncharacterized alpha-E superfamily protein
MLSRTAENLYWLARYVERAEYLARTIEATLRVTALPNTYIGKTNEWDSALLTAGVSASFYKIHNEADERNAITVAPSILPISTAASPTPPPAPCTSSTSSGRSWPRSISA